MSTRWLAALLLATIGLPLSCGSDPAPSSAPPGASGGDGESGNTAGGKAASSGGSAAGGVGTGGKNSGSTAGAAAAAADGGRDAGAAAGDGGAAGRATGGDGGASPTACAPWPSAGETVELTATLEVSGTFDGGLKRYVGAGDLGGDGQDEDLPPLMQLADGAVLQNVVLGKPASDGIHCSGSCTLRNVWWEDVGEDAATLEGDDPQQVMLVDCAGARQASDKVFQHNGPGTVELRRVYVEDFGKLYRSCGNCSSQYQRHVVLVDVHASQGDVLVGINETYGDTADFTRVTADEDITVCSLYEANDTGDEPEEISSGPDPDHCRYQEADIQRP